MKIQHRPTWLSPGLVDTTGNVPILLEEGHTGGFTYAHIMLKPEFFHGYEGSDIHQSILEKIKKLCHEADLMISPWYKMQLDMDMLQIIYQNELLQGWIPQNRIDSLTNEPTSHLIAVGKNASLAATIIRGRHACAGVSTCFMKYLPRDDSFDVPRITYKCPEALVGEKVFGRGCGIRQDFIDAGILRDDHNGNGFNMIHASTHTDGYVERFAQILNEAVIGPKVVIYPL